MFKGEVSLIGARHFESFAALSMTNIIKRGGLFNEEEDLALVKFGFVRHSRTGLSGIQLLFLHSMKKTKTGFPIKAFGNDDQENQRRRPEGHGCSNFTSTEDL